MDQSLKDWVLRYPKNMQKNALKEAIQNYILEGLSQTDFFSQAAFYGGTALRLFYQLPRFSEDLDFTLLRPNPEFSLSNYFPAVKAEVNSHGLQFEVQEKTKQNSSSIQSAYLRGNEKRHFLLFYPDEKPAIEGNKALRIKFELDTSPATGFHCEWKSLHNSKGTSVRLLDKPSLFAGKSAAVVSRNWEHRIKGRDWYDFVYYVESKTPLNLEYFWSQLKRYPDYQSMEPTLANAKLLLVKRFQEIPIEQVKPDVQRFLPWDERQKVANWSTQYFVQLTDKIQDMSYSQSHHRFVVFADSSQPVDVSHENAPKAEVSSKSSPKKTRKRSQKE